MTPACSSTAFPAARSEASTCRHRMETSHPSTPSQLTGRNAPEPFKSEPTGSSGVRMRHKFIVIDFDKPTARVYLGSYNFSEPDRGPAIRRNVPLSPNALRTQVRAPPRLAHGTGPRLPY